MFTVADRLDQSWTTQLLAFDGSRMADFEPATHVAVINYPATILFHVRDVAGRKIRLNALMGENLLTPLHEFFIPVLPHSLEIRLALNPGQGNLPR